MKKVIKVMMFVWRKTANGADFLLVHRRKGDVVTPTGHVEEVPKESFEEAVKREIKEEMGVLPLAIIDLNYTIQAKLKEMGYLSTEHAFLVQVPAEGAKYVENDEPSTWHNLDELSKLMTYPTQKGAIKNIEAYFRSIKN